ncbi:hypothetical protein B0H14DRAFT_2607508 [Mycena olivaceomarginata]|nr:hypothetical protein B0H14DRAFT_2607508 [Mycena olivaceomarginata]
MDTREAPVGDYGSTDTGRIYIWVNIGVRGRARSKRERRASGQPVHRSGGQRAWGAGIEACVKEGQAESERRVAGNERAWRGSEHGGGGQRAHMGQGASTRAVGSEHAWGGERAASSERGGRQGASARAAGSEHEGGLR